MYSLPFDDIPLGVWMIKQEKMWLCGGIKEIKEKTTVAIFVIKINSQMGLM